VYVPSGKLWADEADRFLQLFQDYVTKVGRLAVRLDYKKTDHGAVYEFHGEQGRGQSSLVEEFREFSTLMDLCASDRDAAGRMLERKSLPVDEITRIVARYSKEAKRLQLDLKHTAELKMTSLRQRVESELLDLEPTAQEWQTISLMLTAAVPQFGSLLPPPSNALRQATNYAEQGGRPQVTYNVIRPQFIQTVNGIVAVEMNGTQHFGPDDQRLLEFIRSHAKENRAQLETAVHELSDYSGKPADRIKAGQKLKTFLIEAMKHIGEKGSDAVVEVLRKIIEKKMGL
jgi:hypothetical protein